VKSVKRFFRIGIFEKTADITLSLAMAKIRLTDASEITEFFNLGAINTL